MRVFTDGPTRGVHVSRLLDMQMHTNDFSRTARPAGARIGGMHYASGITMFSLIYVSTAVQMFGQLELLEILRAARLFNEREKITGMLLYKSGNFMQMLEGDAPVVMRLYESIRRDGRHRNVTTILEREIEKRNFQHWTMGFRDMDLLHGQPDFDEFLDLELHQRTFHEDSQFAHRFISTFNRNNH